MPDGRTDQLFDIGPIVEKYFLASQTQEQQVRNQRISQGRPSNVHLDYYSLFDWVWHNRMLDKPYFDLVKAPARTPYVAAKCVAVAAGEITEILASSALTGIIAECDPDQTFVGKKETDQLITEVELERLKRFPTPQNLARAAQNKFEHDGSRTTKNTVLGDIEITGYQEPPHHYLTKKVNRLRAVRQQYPEVFQSFVRVDLVVPKGVPVPEIEGINEPFRLPYTFWQGASFVAEFYFGYAPANQKPLTDIRPEFEEHIVDGYTPPSQKRFFIPRYASI